uniref:Uncharacterized protein n=1 Tax=Acanthochromis polyacanthus TaxID=80966 RepID=A0A3Q1F3C1_9TELE
MEVWVTLLAVLLYVWTLVWRRRRVLELLYRFSSCPGCDSGFGQALVERLSLTGLKVFAGVLDLNGPGAQRLRDLQRENLQLLKLDITDAAQVEAALQHVSTQVSNTGKDPCWRCSDPDISWRSGTSSDFTIFFQPVSRYTILSQYFLMRFLWLFFKLLNRRTTYRVTKTKRKTI